MVIVEATFDNILWGSLLSNECLYGIVDAVLDFECLFAKFNAVLLLLFELIWNAVDVDEIGDGDGGSPCTAFVVLVLVIFADFFREILYFDWYFRIWCWTLISSYDKYFRILFKENRYYKELIILFCSALLKILYKVL